VNNSLGRQPLVLGILALIVLVGVAFGGYQVGRSQSDDEPEPEPTPVAAQPTATATETVPAVTQEATASSATPQGEAAQDPGCWSQEPNWSEGYPQWSSAPEMKIDPSKTYTATIETNRGDIVVELYPDKAPNAVNNFVCLANAGYYDVTVFHRIITGFMIQTGDPTGTGRGGPGYTFADELPGDDMNYDRGVLAMANAGANTNGSQFFINHQDNGADLQKNYTIFGKVTEGMDVVDMIASTPVEASATGEPSAPTVTVGIKTIVVRET
jgi:cyclophilin family peptidyl-prolyl cis-trans isomerase